jgi:hypothetical protein
MDLDKDKSALDKSSRRHQPPNTNQIFQHSCHGTSFRLATLRNAFHEIDESGMGPDPIGQKPVLKTMKQTQR